MSIITTINNGDAGSVARGAMNTNFSNLDTDKLESSDIAGKQDILSEGAFIDGDKTKLDGITTGANIGVVPNANIVGATKTKITYDIKGLVTSGDDATTADIAASTDKNYVTDAEAVIIGNTSGANSGDNATNTQYSGLEASKQDTLVSGTNIKTINSTSILGPGDIEITGTGDMVLADIQTVTGLKTFDKDKAAMKGTSTGVNTISVANTSATDYTNTIPAKTGTFAMTDDITGTNSGTNTGDITLAGTPDYITITDQVLTRNAIDLTTDVTGILPSANGGTANGFTKFTGPTTAEKTFTLPDANSTILVDGGALGTPSGGTLTNATGLPLTGLVDDTTTALGVGSLELGHASDTTLSRSAAGILAVEGVVIPSISSTDTLTNKTLTDPKITTAINTQTGTTYTLVLTDASKSILANNANAQAYTIPLNASVAFPVGTTLIITQYGAGIVTLSGDTGVTVNGVSAGSVATSEIYGTLALEKIGTDEWLVLGGASGAGDMTAAVYDAAGIEEQLVGLTATQTLTNKRITERTNTITSSATPTPAGDSTDIFTVTALGAAAAFAAPTGTPTNGQVLLIRIKDDGTARALTWNAIYRASSDLALPSTTVLSKTLYLQFVYNSTDSKWDLLGLLNNF